MGRRYQSRHREGEAGGIEAAHPTREGIVLVAPRVAGEVGRRVTGAARARSPTPRRRRRHRSKSSSLSPVPKSPSIPRLSTTERKNAADKLKKEEEEKASQAVSNSTKHCYLPFLVKEQARKEREELDKMLEENRRRVEEAQRREALELQSKEEERYRELELIQRQKEEAARRKKMEEEEEHAPPDEVV
ncbi:hypothetical protein M0R45_005742 [Rubus argutus]|uniref:Uncharacterized protein n=1 Tax=Rubus argutus TaxID=59490 RepID=A0AAW1YNI5_RUBAR